MTHFIVATDMSERGDRAVHRAGALAAAAGARLTVLTIVDEALPSALSQTMRVAAEAELQRIVQSFAAESAAAAEIAVVAGDPAEAVARHVAETGADLLIVGRHRPRAIADLFRQTTVERIVALVSCPVLMVAAPPSGPYARVLTPVDFSPAAAAAAAGALALAPAARHEGLHVFHVPYKGLMPGDNVGTFLHEAEHAQAAWHARYAIKPTALPIRLVEGGVQSVLAEEIARLKPDLIAVGAHGRTAVSKALLGSVATTLMRDPPCDLLIARPAPAPMG